MKKYIFDLLYIGSIIIALIIILSNVSFPQINVQVKPYPGAIEMTWDFDSTGSSAEYLIFYCAGADTNLFPVKENATYAEVWDWWIASSLYNYHYVKIKTDVLPEPFYLRLGIIAIGWDGQFSTMKCIPEVLTIMKPPKPKGLKTNFIK